MTLTLQLPDDVREALARAAQTEARTPEEAALDTLRRVYVSGEAAGGPTRSRAECLAHFKAWAARQDKNSPALPDEAISREALYNRDFGGA